MVVGSTRFGHYLRSLRQSRHLTLEQVERLTRDDPEPITRSLLSRLENGKARVSTLKLMALSRLYRVRVATLVERLETDHETAQISGRELARLSPEQIHERAQQLARAGRVRQACLIYETLAERGDARAGEKLVSAKIALGRSLIAERRFQSARWIVDELMARRLGPQERCWSLLLCAQACLGLRQKPLAHAAVRALEEMREAWCEQIEHGAALLDAQLTGREASLEQSREVWLRALDQARRVDDVVAEIECLCELAAAERRRGTPPRAEFWSQKALDLTSGRGVRALLPRVLTEIGRIQRAVGSTEKARQSWTRARRIARELDRHDDLFAVYVELWRLATTKGDTAEVRSCLRCLRPLARQVETWPEGTEQLRGQLRGQPRGSRDVRLSARSAAGGTR